MKLEEARMPPTRAQGASAYVASGGQRVHMHRHHCKAALIARSVVCCVGGSRNVTQIGSCRVLRKASTNPARRANFPSGMPEGVFAQSRGHMIYNS